MNSLTLTTLNQRLGFFDGAAFCTNIIHIKAFPFSLLLINGFVLQIRIRGLNGKKQEERIKKERKEGEVHVIAVAVTSQEKWVSSIFTTMTKKHHTTLSFILVRGYSRVMQPERHYHENFWYSNEIAFLKFSCVQHHCT